MDNYKTYCTLKSELNKKTLLLASLKRKKTDCKEEITTLEIGIEEDLNALNMIFNYLILDQNMSKLEEIL